MNCFDCAAFGVTSGAVSVCAECGAGLCIDHAHVTLRWLTRTMVIDRVVAVDPPARTIRCGTCHAAHQALDHTARAVRPDAPHKHLNRR